MNSKPYYRYMLEGIDTNSFTDKKLLPVEDAVETTFNVKSIVNKKIINENVYYLVQYADKDRLWIDKNNLIKDNLKILLMIMKLTNCQILILIWKWRRNLIMVKCKMEP